MKTNNVKMRVVVGSDFCIMCCQASDAIHYKTIDRRMFESYKTFHSRCKVEVKQWKDYFASF